MEAIDESDLSRGDDGSITDEIPLTTNENCGRTNTESGYSLDDEVLNSTSDTTRLIHGSQEELITASDHNGCPDSMAVVTETHNIVSTRHRTHERWWTTLLAVLVSSLLAVLFGCSLGFPSPVLLELSKLTDSQLKFDVLLSDIFSGSGLVGGLFGGPPAGWVADRWGRKNALILNSVPYLIGYLMISTAYLITNGVAFKSVLILGRFITGFGMGWSYLAVSVYNGEISSAKTRGVFGSFAELALVIGILFVYGVASIPGFTYTHISLVMLGLVAVFVLTAVWLPETPRWVLLKTKNRQRAKSIMKLLRGNSNSKDIDTELDDIQKTIEKTLKLSFVKTVKQFFQRSILVPFTIILVLMIFQELCGGGSTVATYAAPIFQAAGVSNPDLVSLFGVGGTQLLFTAIGVLIIDRIGRKLLLIVSAIGMLTGSTMLGVHFYITRPSLCANNSTVIDFVVMEDASNTVVEISHCNTHFAPLAITSLILFIASFSVGFGPVLWVLLTEYLPLHIRGTASGIVILLNWMAAAFVTGVYLSYAELVKPWFAWWTFAIINLFGLLFVIAFVVETKGKSLEEVQQMFEKKPRTATSNVSTMV